MMCAFRMQQNIQILKETQNKNNTYNFQEEDKS